MKKSGPGRETAGARDVSGFVADGAAHAHASPQDQLLVERLLEGDEEAFVSIVAQHHGALLRLAQVFVSSRAAAEEVVQETWLAVIDGLRAFERRSSLKTWIFHILTNRAKTRGVREGRYVPFASVVDPNDDQDRAVDPALFRPNGRWAVPPRRWDEGTPEKLLMEKQAMQRLEQAIGELPPNQRVVLTLRDIDGLDSGEICKMLDISEANQRVLLHRARSKVRAVLDGYVERK